MHAAQKANRPTCVSHTLTGSIRDWRATAQNTQAHGNIGRHWRKSPKNISCCSFRPLDPVTMKRKKSHASVAIGGIDPTGNTMALLGVRPWPPTHNSYRLTATMIGRRAHKSRRQCRGRATKTTSQPGRPSISTLHSNGCWNS